MIEKLQRIPLREVWKHEAYDFTKYLQQNIDVLNDLLDFTLSNPEYEQSAGSFSEEDKVFKSFRDRLYGDEAVRKSAEVNTPENAREMIDEHFDFYKKFNDDKDFREAPLHMMYADFQQWLGEGRSF